MQTEATVSSGMPQGRSMQSQTSSVPQPQEPVQQGPKLPTLSCCRCQKVNSSSYQAFDSPGYPPLAILGIDVGWKHKYLLQVS